MISACLLAEFAWRDNRHNEHSAIFRFAVCKWRELPNCGLTLSTSSADE